jgi:hypothetical protein
VGNHYPKTRLFKQSIGCIEDEIGKNLARVREKNKPKFLAGIPEAKTELGGIMRRLVDVINMDFKCVGF